MLTCEVTLLGGFEVRVDGRVLSRRHWRHRRAAELVKILALAEGHHLPRESVTALLWPDLDPAAASANLRKTVHYARAALGSGCAIGTSGGMIELAPGAQVHVDARAFDAAGRAGRLDALGTYRELLPEDRYASWAEEPRERLRLLYLRMLKTAQQWEQVLRVDPVDEEAHRALMRQALEAGDRGAAVRQFERLRERLRADLGLSPDARSVALYQRAFALTGPTAPTAVERVRALLARGLVQLNTGELAAAERAAHRARALAIDAQLGRESGEASALLGILANLRGQWEQRFREEFTAALHQDPSLAAYTLDAHVCLAETCLHGPNGHQGMATYARELLDIANQADSAPARAIAQLLLGQIELFSGRLVTAHELLSAAVRDYQRVKALSGLVLALHRLAEVAVANRRRGQATQLLLWGARAAEQCWLEPHLTVRIHGTLIAAAPTPATAIRRVEHADQILTGRNVCQPCSMGFLLAAADAYARGGRLEQARRRLHQAERLAGLWTAGAWHAAIWETRGTLRQAEGDTTRAAALFDEAADQFAEIGRTFDHDRCRTKAHRTRPRSHRSRNPAPTSDSRM